MCLLMPPSWPEAPPLIFSMQLTVIYNERHFFFPNMVQFRKYELIRKTQTKTAYESTETLIKKLNFYLFQAIMLPVSWELFLSRITSGSIQVVGTILT